MDTIDEERSVFLNHILPFMNKKYFLNILSLCNTIKEINVENDSFSIPKYTKILFDNPKSRDDFLQKMNHKFLDENINLKFVFDSREKQINNLIESEQYEEIKFPIQYDKMINTVYEKTYREPGLIFNDKELMSKQNKVIGYLIKKMGSNLIKGKSIMNISLPVTIFDKRTLHHVFAYEMSFASYYLNRAYYSIDPKTKFNWIITFLITQLYLSPLQYKPFSPIIGETLQCKIGDLDLYLEQTSSKPIVCNFYGISVNYKIHGYISTSAATGVNSVKACKQGKFYIDFNDGNSYELLFPQIYIKGTTLGKRVFNFKKMSAVIDKKNNLSAIIKFNPDEKGFFSSLFSSKQKSSPDTFIGEIFPYSDFIYEDFLNYSIKYESQNISLIRGEWTDHLIIENKYYWKMNDYSLLPIFKPEFVLPSDSSFRKDLIALRENNEENAQKYKEEIEELQRHDRRLREIYHKKHKKEY